MGPLLPLIRWIARLLPPTVHPMVVHFPIVFLYVTSAIDMSAMVLADRDRFLQRAGFWLLTASCVSIIAAMAAGLVSEQSVHWSPAMARVLGTHQRFAVLTGASAGAAWLFRVGTRYSDGAGWTLFGRGRGTWWSTALVVLAAVCVTITATLGGRMVYDYGAGVAGVTRVAVPGA